MSTDHTLNINFIKCIYSINVYTEEEKINQHGFLVMKQMYFEDVRVGLVLVHSKQGLSLRICLIYCPCLTRDPLHNSLWVLILETRLSPDFSVRMRQNTFDQTRTEN